METESLQYPSTSTWSSSLPPPPQIPVETVVVTLISKFGIRYEGFFYYVNRYDSTLGLRNVICYGTEGRNIVGFQIPPSSDIYEYIIFTLTEIEHLFGYGYIPRGATTTTNSKLSHATKPPLPLTFSSHNPLHGAKISQKVPLISSDIASNLLAHQPQLYAPNFYDPWFNYAYHQTMPYGVLHQAPPPPINAASELVFAPLSFFTTFPPVPISLRQSSGGFEFEALSKNFKQYEVWNRQENNNQTASNNKEAVDNTNDGSFYMISRNPFDPIGRPCNTFGNIERLDEHELHWGHQLQLIPSTLFSEL